MWFVIMNQFHLHILQFWCDRNTKLPTPTTYNTTFNLKSSNKYNRTGNFYIEKVLFWIFRKINAPQNLQRKSI